MPPVAQTGPLSAGDNIPRGYNTPMRPIILLLVIIAVLAVLPSPADQPQPRFQITSGAYTTVGSPGTTQDAIFLLDASSGEVWIWAAGMFDGKWAQGWMPTTVGKME